jgi:DnaK suppressor protein
MDAEALEIIRNKLLAMRRDMAGGIEALKREGFSLGTDGTQDVADDAANTYARQMLLGLSERERAVIRQIDEALDRIEAGDFGLCEDCGDEIGEARLLTLPYATLCVECKAKQEMGPR